MEKKTFDHMFTHFDRMHERDRQSDRQTDRRTRTTVQAAPTHSIARQQELSESANSAKVVAVSGKAAVTL